MSTSMDVSRWNAFLFINFMWIITVISIIPGFWCKECTNIPTQLSSHTLRYEILTSSNASWREEMFSLYPLIESEELAWSGLLPQGKLDKEKSFSAEEEFNWTMLYRGMRYASKMNSPSGENILQEVPLEKVWLDPNSLHGLAQQTNLEYLLMLNVDNLVWSFRKTAGLPTPGTPYGGWESPTIELRGHFVGHYMSSSALMWASTHNTTLKEHMTAVVNALDECQKAIGTGYLSAFPPELFDRFEAIQPVWAPYYTIHKILAGLLDQYTLAGNAQALQITLEMANYFYDRVQNVISQHTIERHWLSLNEETGGMNDVLYRLYTITGDGKHLELAHLFDKPCFLGLLAVQTDGLSGFHANTHIPIVVGSQMRYEVTGDPLYKEIGTYFMDIVNSSHSYATGGTSVNEFWSDPNRLASTLQAENEESCTTYNMLKVARHLFRWTKAMVYADYYERALTNGVLSIQRGREPGVMIYMLPQGPGDSKARSFHGWGTQFNSFWCCYGTGIESFSKLGDSIYFQENGTSPNLYIIQFISSMLTWDAAGVTLKQTVEPLSSWNPYLHVSMVFNFISERSKPLEADSGESTVNIRIPFWMYVDGAQAMLNAEALSLPYPGNFLTISRQWKSNDNVSLSFPVGLRTESIKDDRPQFKSVQAILFGPYLLAGMTDGDWDLQLGNTSSFSDWITAVPAGFASQLFTFGQEWKISGSDESNNNTLVLTNSNTSILMEPFPQEGTDQAAHATFRIIDSSTEKTPKEYKMQKSALAVDFVGKDVYLEPFDHPGMVVAHQGINNTLTIYPRAQLSLANKKPCSLTYCMSLSEGSNAVFKVVPGLDGNQNSVSFESTNLPSCFVYGGTSYQAGQAVLLQCRPVTTDIGFDRAASFISSTGVSTYHPISFIATGSKRSYLLAPLFTFRDESYTVYFNITS